MATNENKLLRLTKEMRGKLTVTYVVIICLFLLLAGRIIIWNIQHGKQYSTTVLGQQTNSNAEIPYERGKIYDRNGNLLAGNEKLYTLIIEPKNILSGSEDEQKECMDTTIQVVSQYFGVNATEIRQAILRHEESYYVPLKKEITYQTVEAFNQFYELRNEEVTEDTSEERKAEIKKAGKVKGVTFEESYKRIYPYGSMACHLLGFTSSGNVGNWGIEQYYNSTLNGTNGRLYYYFDEELVREKTIKEAVNGNSLISTIDLQIQQVVEEKIKDFDERIGSKETSVIVMDPNNGEILAMANSDPYDLNDPFSDDNLLKKYSSSSVEKILAHTEAIKEAQKNNDEETLEKLKKATTLTKTEALNKVWRNPIISDTHEPGSTYKPFTVSAGLESGVLNGKETYVCTGSYVAAKHTIGCSHVHGEISLKNSVAQSCNVAMMNIAFKEQADSFYYYQNLFGFGKKTGIDLPGEANTHSLVYTAENYGNDASLATNSFGQNFNCTMVEMASAFASLINGGYYYKPHVIKEIQNANGDIVETEEKEMYRQTISEATSKTIRSYMKETVKSGTGTKTQIAGYSIGGKTGTAEKIPRNKKDYYISFIGFVPVDNPQVLIYVTIDEPNVDNQANASLAVGLHKACLKEILGIMGIAPTEKIKEGEEEKDDDYIKTYLKQNKQKKKKKKKTTEQTTETPAATDPAATTDGATDPAATTEAVATDPAATTETAEDPATTTEEGVPTDPVPITPSPGSTN